MESSPVAAQPMIERARQTSESPAIRRRLNIWSPGISTVGATSFGEGKFTLTKQIDSHSCLDALGFKSARYELNAAGKCHRVYTRLAGEIRGVYRREDRCGRLGKGAARNSQVAHIKTDKGDRKGRERAF